MKRLSMTRAMRLAGITFLAANATMAAASRALILSPQQSTQAPPAVTYRDAPRTGAEFDDMMTKLSNWGRWGKTDTLGAATLITADVRKQAVALAKSGVVVSLAHDALQEKAEDAAGPSIPHRIMPPIDDGLTLAGSFQLPSHSQSMTHLDALCHLLYKGKAYNGFA